MGEIQCALATNCDELRHDSYSYLFGRDGADVEADGGKDALQAFRSNSLGFQLPPKTESTLRLDPIMPM